MMVCSFSFLSLDIMRWIFSFIFILMCSCGGAQNYTSYFTGNLSDIEVVPNGGICLMGGSTEDDMGCAGFWNEQMGEMCW